MPAKAFCDFREFKGYAACGLETEEIYCEKCIDKMVDDAREEGRKEGYEEAKEEFSNETSPK